MDTIYVLLNTKDVQDPGKAAAQATHAALCLVADSFEDEVSPFQGWSFHNPNAVIVLDGKDEETLKRLDEYFFQAKGIGMYRSSYIDEGTDFHITALAVGPMDKNDPKTKAILGQFKLWNPLKRIQDRHTEMAAKLKWQGFYPFPDEYINPKKKAVAEVLEELEKPLITT